MTGIQERKIVYLVDGSSYIHRAYHAIRNLSNSRGFPTNAIFGFTKMILKLFDEKNPRYLAIAMDLKGPTFRHKLYSAYKATRPPMPDDMVIQLPYIRRIIEGLSVSLLEHEGYEADDIIGTIAKRAEREGFKIVMVTGDKDFRQLISPRIAMWDTMKDKYVDYKNFVTDYQMEPEQIIDLMGLSGDSSDNIPGVPGVGEKTAARLIAKYGTLENVFEHIHEIESEKLRENLEKSYKDAILSKKLVTIDCHVPLEKEIEDLRVGEPSGEELTQIFRELEFRGLWDMFADRKDAKDCDYRLCLSREEVFGLIEKIKDKKVVCLDTETSSLDPLNAELVGVSLCFEEKRAFYIPVGHLYLGAPEQMSPVELVRELKPVLEDHGIMKVGQNIKYDAMVLKRYGVNLSGIHFDTMVASYVINPGLRQHNLEYLAQQYLNHKMISYHEVAGKGKEEINFSQVSVESAMEYSCEDADITLRLMSILDSRLREDLNHELFYNLEMELIPVLMDMELAGIKIDVGFFNKMSIDFADQINMIRKEIYREAGTEFNINSPVQLGSVLFEKLHLPVYNKTSKTKTYSTDVKVLNKLAADGSRIAELILRFRTLSKLKSTYLDALVRMVKESTGRVHTSFNQTVTATGRLSSSNPNLQNIPIRGEEGREIRKGFIPDDGNLLVSADYSQVELRLFAHYSGDEAFINAFRNDEDIHSQTASEILGVNLRGVTQDMRRIAKAINFGIIYGMGPRKLADELRIENKTAKKYIDSYYERHKGVARYREEIIKTARERGYVTTLLNRRRYLPDINSDNLRIRAEAERMAVNTPIQGSAADLIKKAMVQIHRRLNKDRSRTRMLLQVHDELVFEVPESELEIVTPIIREEMETVYPLNVPLKVDMSYGKNWDEAH
ncbi:MAG: DNA polymerase I [Deltaproteobacteria bacterium]|nr:DNA polymerase I [Deltaproteobacteria bacterium]